MNQLGRCCGLAVCVLGLCASAQTVSAQDVSDELQAKINKAIDKGVAYLKRAQNPNTGYWSYGYGRGDAGATALVGWALLESGVPASDPVIRRAVAVLRQSAVTEKKVYNLSLSIFFFDRLGDPEDIPFIESLATRLMAAQTRDGGWTYSRGDVPAPEQARLARLNANRRGGGVPPKLPRTFAQLDPVIQQECKAIEAAQAQGRNLWMGGDNSNTQFAMIALWVARKYGLPVQPCLARTGQRFVSSQLPDGSWLYERSFSPLVPADKHSPAMTCAGLLGLWLSAANDSRISPKDVTTWLHQRREVKAGFKYLADVMRNMSGQQADKRHYYFLWSLERVGMGYDTKLIDRVKWYQWAAAWLVQAQNLKSGSWPGGEFGDCDAAFALLVLKRVNVLTLTPEKLDINRTIIAKEKKVGPKAKDDLPLPDLSPTGVVPKGDSKKGGDGRKTNGPGGGRSSRLDRPRPEPLAWRPPPQFAATLGEGRREWVRFRATPVQEGMG